MTLPKPSNLAEKRFLSHVQEVPAPKGTNLQSPCWKWTASCTNGGKGRPQFNQHMTDGKQKNTSAARWAYAHFKKQPEANAQLCHLCDNPLCVNPDHLWEDDANGNMQDCIAKGRHDTADALSKLDKAVQLHGQGTSIQAIASILNIDPCEAERLLEFHEEDASFYHADLERFGTEVAQNNRRERLISDYGTIGSAMESGSLARHIKQLDLSV